MLLNKTDKARDALREGAGAGLSLQERRVLILTDGKRSLNEVMALLGSDVLPTIDRLIREGYIGGADPSDKASRNIDPPTVASAFTGLIRAAADAVQAHAAQVRTANPAAASEPPAASATSPRAADAAANPSAATRRSLAAAKMYVLDMLQLQRHPEAIELRARIQCAMGAEAMIDAVLQALRAMPRFSTASYAQRVAARLAEILPEEALARLDAIRSEQPGGPTLSIVAA